MRRHRAAQVLGHRLAQGDQADGLALDIGLQRVELGVAADHRPGPAARRGAAMASMASATCASARPPRRATSAVRWFSSSP